MCLMLYYELLLPVISGNEFNVLITLNTTPPNGVESSLAPWRNCVYYDYLFTLYLLSSVSLTHLTLSSLSLSLSRLRRKRSSCLGRGKTLMEGRSWPHPPLVMEEEGHPHLLLLPLPRRHPSLQTPTVCIQETSPPSPQNHTSLLMSCWLDLTVVIVTAKQCLFGIVGIYM